MIEPPQIPEPSATGVDGTQTAATTDMTVVPKSPFDDLPLAKEIEGLAATKTQAFGGEISSALIAGATRQIAYDLSEVKEELKKTRDKYDAIQTQLAECRERKGILEDRIQTERDSRQLRNISIAIGTALLSLSINLYEGGFVKAAVVTCGLGLLLLVFGWMSLPRSELK